MSNIHTIIQSVRDFWLAEIDQFWFLHHPVLVKSARYSIGSEVKVLRSNVDGSTSEHVWKNTGYDHIDVILRLGGMGNNSQQGVYHFYIMAWKKDEGNVLFEYSNHGIMNESSSLEDWFIEACLMSCVTGISDIV